MDIFAVASLGISDVKVISFKRRFDHRGYFAEHFRQSDFQGQLTPFLHGVRFVQANESYSRAGTVRGLHAQWAPHVGKLVRTLHGRLIDLALDIRKGSPTWGKIIAYDMPTAIDHDYSEWIWVPPGFAHGTVFPIDSAIEYFCSGEFRPGCEVSISPMAPDIDWSLCDQAIRALVMQTMRESPVMSERDRSGLALTTWLRDSRSDNFAYREAELIVRPRRLEFNIENDGESSKRIAASDIDILPLPLVWND